MWDRGLDSWQGGTVLESSEKKSNEIKIGDQDNLSKIATYFQTSLVSPWFVQEKSISDPVRVPHLRKTRDLTLRIRIQCRSLESSLPAFICNATHNSVLKLSSLFGSIHGDNDIAAMRGTINASDC